MAGKYVLVDSALALSILVPSLLWPLTSNSHIQGILERGGGFADDKSGAHSSLLAIVLYKVLVVSLFFGIIGSLLLQALIILFS